MRSERLTFAGADSRSAIRVVRDGLLDFLFDDLLALLDLAQRNAEPPRVEQAYDRHGDETADVEGDCETDGLLVRDTVRVLKDRNCCRLERAEKTRTGRHGHRQRD